MKKLYYLLIPVVILLVIYSLNDNTDQGYLNKIADERADRVRFLKTSSQSPFLQSEKKFLPLDFYQIDPSYRVRANLERIQFPTRMTIQNSDGTSATYARFAYARFKLNGQEMALLILKPASFGSLPNTYFTAFADATSGVATYGGGRYLDLDIGKSDNIEIDFNLAYNPYCAYVSHYSCPLPPPENVLPLAIEAGEKDYTH